MPVLASPRSSRQASVAVAQFAHHLGVAGEQVGGLAHVGVQVVQLVLVQVQLPATGADGVEAVAAGAVVQELLVRGGGAGR